jgi:hypothetical protein
MNLYYSLTPEYLEPYRPCTFDDVFDDISICIREIVYPHCIIELALSDACKLSYQHEIDVTENLSGLSFSP